jgi:glycosyltransferase involved in cell wall biosynthesis
MSGANGKSGGDTTVTIVVPCFNYGRFVRDAVESALRQQVADVQVVVVDDGSTDGRSPRQCDRCQGGRVRVIHQPNQGLPAARNRGAQGAQSEFLIFLDADDWIEPEFVAKLADSLRNEADPAVSHAYSRQRIHGPDAASVWAVPDWDPLMMMVTNLHPVTTLVRRDRFEAVGGFNESMRDGYEDWDLWLKFVERGWRGLRVLEPLFVYRRHSRSTMIWHAVARHEELFRSIVENHRSLYAAHADSVIARMNTLLRRHDMNWLDETGEPISLLALKRQRARYESMAAVKAHHAFHRLIDALPRPFAGAARSALSAIKKIIPPAEPAQSPTRHGGPKSPLSARNTETPETNVGPVVIVLPAGSSRVSWANTAPSTDPPPRVKSAETEIE